MERETSEREREARALLPRAKAGDEDARRTVALYAYERYVGRIGHLYATDPAVTEDDLRAVFFEGVYAHVPLLDGRGDDLYHLGQRGYWAVHSLIRSVRAQMRHRSLAPRPTDARDEGDRADLLPDHAAAETFAMVIDRDHARQRVEVIVNADLRPRERQAVELILAGEAGDPREDGFNKRLAEAMGVSPQRASQVMQSLRDAAA